MIVKCFFFLFFSIMYVPFSSFWMEMCIHHSHTLLIYVCGHNMAILNEHFSSKIVKRFSLENCEKYQWVPYLDFRISFCLFVFILVEKKKIKICVQLYKRNFVFKEINLLLLLSSSFFLIYSCWKIANIFVKKMAVK